MRDPEDLQIISKNLANGLWSRPLATETPATVAK
jgi:hypothetical protein